jgi:AmmeMemoRadiSam system protein B
VALVVPHAGWAYSGAAAAAAFATLARGDFARVVVVGPSHHAWLDGFAVSDAAAFATPLGRVPICPEARALTELAGVTTSRGAHDPEHAIEIELPFLQQALGDFCLVPLLTGDTTPDQERSLAERLARLDDGRTLFVFSTDFVHYGESFDFTPFGPSAAKAHARVDELDERAIRLLEAGDADELRSFFATTGATICGRRGLSVLLELLARAAPGARGTVLAHYSSLELEPPGRGDDGVWYVAMAFERAGSASAAARSRSARRARRRWSPPPRPRSTPRAARPSRGSPAPPSSASSPGATHSRASSTPCPPRRSSTALRPCSSPSPARERSAAASASSRPSTRSPGGGAGGARGGPRGRALRARGARGAREPRAGGDGAHAAAPGRLPPRHRARPARHRARARRPAGALLAPGPRRAGLGRRGDARGALAQGRPRPRRLARA